MEAFNQWVMKRLVVIFHATSKVEKILKRNYPEFVAKLIIHLSIWRLRRHKGYNLI